MSRRSRDLFEHLVPFDQFAKSCVLPIEKSRRAMADEELAAGGIGVIRACHRKHASVVMPIIELGLDFVTGIARAPTRFFVRVFSQRIAPLDHKSLDDTMEASAVIKTLSSQRFKILYRFRSNITPKLNNHFTSGGGDPGNFVVHGLNVPAHGPFVTRRIRAAADERRRALIAAAL